MRISKTDSIADLPAHEIRTFFRFLRGSSFHRETLQSRLKLPDDQASKVMSDLLAEDLITPDGAVHGPDDEPYYGLTDDGWRLTMSSVRSPFKRSTADRAVSDLLRRLKAYNDDPRVVDEIAEVYVFGSYLDQSVGRVGDVDLALSIRRRRDPTQAETADALKRLRFLKSNANPLSLWSWDAFRILTGRSPVLSLIDLDAHRDIVLGGPHRRIWPNLPEDGRVTS